MNIGFFCLNFPKVIYYYPSDEKDEHVIDSMQCSCQPTLKFSSETNTPIIMHTPFDAEPGDEIEMVCVIDELGIEESFGFPYYTTSHN